MIVIIAEKPSLAKNIAAAIDPKLKITNGYAKNDKYYITYVFGHLFELYDIEKYSPDYSPNQKIRWTLDNLPFYPNPFRFGLKRDEGTIAQFKIIRELVNKEEVDTIVNAGDSDREGEIIVRLIIQNTLKTPKKISRLWMPDQTPKTIKKELDTMRDDSDYDNLANEGYARTYIDWMFGINLTRYATIKSGKLLRVGRVIAPIVRVIYDREMEIRAFIPRKYYALVSKCEALGEKFDLTSKVEFDLTDNEEKNKEILHAAKEKCNELNSKKCVVKNITSEPKTIPAPKLFSLSDLQGVLGKKFKFSLDKSLSLVQSLYEKGYCTYPRTPSNYLAENEKDKFREIISNFHNVGKNIIFKDNKYIFDDSKIESHSAITPTYKIPKKSDLTEDELKVYSTIANRFFAVFAKEPCVTQKTTIELSIPDIEDFKLNGDVMSSKGWTEFEPRDKKDKFLPNFAIGDEFDVNFKPTLKETKAPKRYSTESLNNFLKNPFKDKQKQKKQESDEEKDDTVIEDDSEDYKAMFEGVELGTEATRSGIINNAIKQKYISLKNNIYYLEPDGEFYINALEQLKINMPKEKTAELGRSLKKVYKGEITIDDCVDLAKQEINVVFEQKNVSIDGMVIGLDVCECPFCKQGRIIGNRFGFYCDNSECKKGIGLNNKYFEALGVRISPALVRILFTEKEVYLKNLTSKKGNKYNAYIQMEYNEGDKYPTFKMHF